jgi:hypothetical protein
MIIRATKKLLNTSGIESIKNLTEPVSALPGEWYAGLVPTGIPGKMVIHFLHYPTKISIFCQGKSLNKALPELPGRVEQLLKRKGFSKLVFQFQLYSEAEIFATNNRSMLSHMNQLKYALEYEFYITENIEEINFDKIEDSFSNWLFSSKGSKKYEKPTEILKNLAD